VFFTVAGTHGTGKSHFMTLFTEALGIKVQTEKVGRSKPESHFSDDDRCVLLAKYGRRDDGILTGGMDGTGTQQRRYDMIAGQWMNPERQLVIAESHMIWYFKSIWNPLAENVIPDHPRKILAIHLEVPIEEIKKRWEKRSKGKPFDAKRESHLLQKRNGAEKFIRNLKSHPVLAPHSTVLRLPHITEDDSTAAVAIAIQHIKDANGWELNKKGDQYEWAR